MTLATHEVTEKAVVVVEAAKLVKITSKETYVEAAGLWKELQAMGKEIKEAFNSIIQKAHQAHAEAIAQRDRYLDPVEKASRSVKSLMSAYDAEQERLRREAQARLEAEARRREEEARLAEAIAMEQAGQVAEAEAILAEPIQTPTIIVQKETPKVEGGPVFRTIWKFRITDALAIPREYLVPDEVKIGQVVRALKGATSIPGVQPYEERV